MNADAKAGDLMIGDYYILKVTADSVEVVVGDVEEER